MGLFSNSNLVVMTYKTYIRLSKLAIFLNIVAVLIAVTFFCIGNVHAQSFINDHGKVYIPAIVNNDSEVRIYTLITYTNDSTYNLNWHFYNSPLEGNILMYGWYFMPPADSVLSLIRTYVDTVNFKPFFNSLEFK